MEEVFRLYADLYKHFQYPFTVAGFFQGTYVILEAFGCWFQLLAFLFQIQPSREKPMTSFNMLFFKPVTGNCKP